MDLWSWQKKGLVQRLLLFSLHGLRFIRCTLNNFEWKPNLNVVLLFELNTMMVLLFDCYLLKS